MAPPAPMYPAPRRRRSGEGRTGPRSAAHVACHAPRPHLPRAVLTAAGPAACADGHESAYEDAGRTSRKRAQQLLDACLDASAVAGGRGKARPSLIIYALPAHPRLLIATTARAQQVAASAATAEQAHGGGAQSCVSSEARGVAPPRAHPHPLGVVMQERDPRARPPPCAGVAAGGSQRRAGAASAAQAASGRDGCRAPCQDGRGGGCRRRRR